MSKKGSKKSFSLTLRNYFITGVVVLRAIGFTLYLTKFLIDNGYKIEEIALISALYISLSLILLFLIRGKLNPIKIN